MLPDPITDHDLRSGELTDYIIGLLAPLGDTADTIADRLAALGISTERGTGACPIFDYLRRVEPGIECGIDFDTLEVWLASGLAGSVPVPAPVLWFVLNFDRGHYPQLVTSPQHSSPADPGTTGRTETAP